MIDGVFLVRGGMSVCVQLAMIQLYTISRYYFSEEWITHSLEMAIVFMLFNVSFMTNPHALSHHSVMDVAVSIMTYN